MSTRNGRLRPELLRTNPDYTSTDGGAGASTSPQSIGALQLGSQVVQGQNIAPGSVDHSSQVTNVQPNQHHSQVHAISGTDHTGVITDAQHGVRTTPGQHPTFVGSGATHAVGDVPDPGAVAGTTKYLREDATWGVPPGTVLPTPPMSFATLVKMA